MQKKVVTKDQIYVTVVVSTLIAVITATFGGVHEVFVVNGGLTKRAYTVLWVIMSLVLSLLMAGLAYLSGSYAIDSGSILAYVATLALLIVSLKFVLTSGKAWKNLR